jgi:hypothetical protein
MELETSIHFLVFFFWSNNDLKLRLETNIENKHSKHNLENSPICIWISFHYLQNRFDFSRDHPRRIVLFQHNHQKGLTAMVTMAKPSLLKDKPFPCIDSIA